MEVVPYLEHSVRRWQIGSSTFLAWPEAGARLMHWSVTRGDGSVRDVIHWPDLKEIGDIARVRGGNPILFPFSGRTFDEGEIQRWRDPRGVVRPMPMHGFARNGTFRLTEISETGFDAVLEPDDAAREAYPFEYEFKVCYRFGALSLACEFVLTNHGSEPLPWSAGHHFYFSVPWNEGLSRGDYRIRLSTGRVMRQDATGALVAAPALPAELSLAEPALIDALHLNLKSPTCTFGNADRTEAVSVTLGTSRVPPAEAAFVTWTEREDSPFYCVEPWMGPPNAAGNKVGLHWVNPGQSQHFSVEVQVH